MATAAEFEERVERADSAAEVEELLDELRARPDAGRDVLEELARSGAVETRGWAGWAAARVLPKADAVSILKRLARDRDMDVRDGAIEDLLDLDPAEARTLVPRIRRQLKSSDIYAPVAAMWTLAKLRDNESLPLVRDLAENGRVPFHRKSAFVVALFLAGDMDEIVGRIRGHDHDLMPWLAAAARLLGTPKATAALEECARTAPDAECRHFCRAELERREK